MIILFLSDAGSISSESIETEYISSQELHGLSFYEELSLCLFVPL